MRLSLSYCLASSALVLALPASPVFAHMHHHASYRHHHAHLAAAQNGCGSFFGLQLPCPQRAVFTPSGPSAGASADGGTYSGMAAAQAGASGVPQSLIDRVIARESGGNPRAVSHGNYGLMQIRLSTARAMGYTGSAAGLLDPQTNMTYAVRYLAGAYRAAGGNEARAIALYSRGYYYEAKRRGFSPYAASPRPQLQYASFTSAGSSPATAQRTPQ